MTQKKTSNHFIHRFPSLRQRNALSVLPHTMLLVGILAMSANGVAATQSQDATGSNAKSMVALHNAIVPIKHRDVAAFVKTLMTDDGVAQSNTALCARTPSAVVRINGDLVIRGGSLAVLDATERVENFSVSGALTLGDASQATISGCVNGNVTLQGGGVDDGGHLYSNATIRIDQMRNPSQATLWGRDISIGNGVSGGNYRTIAAGAYATQVIHQGKIIGTAIVGGRLIPSTVTGGTPWSQGIVKPLPSGKVELTLQHDASLVIDLSRVTIDPVTGQLSHIRAAVAEAPAGHVVIPDTLTFKATQIVGGHVQLAQVETDHLWGNTVTVSGFGGNYKSLWSNSNLTIGTGKIGQLVGGGDLYAANAGLYWNFPEVDDGEIMGRLYFGASHALVEDPHQALARVRTEQLGVSPGLPGRPYCDTRVQPVAVDTFLPHANYIFFRTHDGPHLAIRHVRTADGAVLDGIYRLQDNDLRTLHGQPFFACNWQSSHQLGARCFSPESGSKAWIFNGVTHFPRGIVWFDGPVIINGTQINDADGNQNLVNTVLARGAVTLTQAGHNALQAPNYVSADILCHGPFQPDNFCGRDYLANGDNVQPVSQHSPGFDPLGNQALATEDDAQLAGWTISGNVAIGGNFMTEANKTTIFGGVRIGANRKNAVTTITQGGADIYLPKALDRLNDPVDCSSHQGAMQ